MEASLSPALALTSKFSLFSITKGIEEEVLFATSFFPIFSLELWHCTLYCILLDGFSTFFTHLSDLG